MAMRINVREFQRGYLYGQDSFAATDLPAGPAPANWLEGYFDAHTTGPGLWKWRHYFDIYDRHFSKFRGREVHILEVGIYSGGSLDMWRSYFGDKAHVYGVDIEPACRVYEGPGTQVFIGDQADSEFWRQVLRQVPPLDIVIDDGGHKPSQQIPTLEALLPHLRPGGVYLCEDIKGEFNSFNSYVDGLSRNLHNTSLMSENLDLDPGEMQRSIDSVHHYPFVAVIEKRAQQLEKMSAPKHGTEWQPFLPVSLPG
jgi:Methyltransferase domain